MLDVRIFLYAICPADRKYRHTLGQHHDPLGRMEKRSSLLSCYLACLLLIAWQIPRCRSWEMRRAGYTYAVIGNAGEPGFFKLAAEAVEIPDANPGSRPPE